jgi:RNA polymerase sigma factor (sigma-70 family)
MSREQVSGLIQKLELTLASNDLATVPDQQLVTRFTTDCDETAFRVIAARHGPMVYRVCRRVLGNEQDVEDAFQATFLVFVRKVGSIRKLKSLASWLHGVAYQVSLRMRTSSQRQRVREVLVADRDETIVIDDMSWKEVRSIVDEELTRLPEQMREPLVLCYLEGLTQDEAAAQLGLTKRTLQRRLEHGRERLGARLTRRGLGLSGALTASLLSECVVAMPPPLMATTGSLVQDVLGGKSLSVLSHRLTALTQEVIESMFPNRLNMKWLVVALLGMGLATAAIGTQFSREELPETSVAQASEEKKDNKLDTKPENPPTDGIMWGEAVEGLKAGISFRPGEEHSSRLGGSATFAVYLRNETKKPISITHNENVFDEFLPSVQDAGGKKVTVYPGPIFLGMVSRVDRTLNEGEIIRLGTAWFLIKGANWRGTVVSPTLRTEPGKYRVSCANFPFRRKGKDSDEMLWSTGWVDLTIESETQVGQAKLNIEWADTKSDSKTIELFNGKDLSGWKVRGEEDRVKPPGEAPMWQVCGVHLDEKNPDRFIGGIVNTPGGIGRVISNVYPGKHDLYTQAKFGDCHIEFEFMVAKGSKSAVYVMGEYQMTIRDSYGVETLGETDLGGILNSRSMPIVGGPEWESLPEHKRNPSKKIGEWQKIAFDFIAPTFIGDKKHGEAQVKKVILNDKLINWHEYFIISGPSPGGLTGKESRTGPLMFHCEEGPIAFRNIKITPKLRQAVIPVPPKSKNEIKEESLKDEQIQVDLAYDYIRTNNFRSAELCLRKQLQQYPTGPQASLGKFLLGVCLVQLATVPPPGGPSSAKANTQREEALRLFRNIVSDLDAELKKGSKLSDYDAWLKVQAAIRILQVHLHMRNHTDLLYEAQDLLQRQRGTVDELIVWSLIYKSFEQQCDEVKMLQTRDKIKEVFDSLPDSAFNSSSVEYTREYWEKTWYSR